MGKSLKTLSSKMTFKPPPPRYMFFRSITTVRTIVLCLSCFIFVISLKQNALITFHASIFVISYAVIYIPCVWWRQKYVNKDILFSACQDGNLSEIHYQIFYGADKDSRDSLDNTPLMICCGFGHLECVEYLLRSGADISKVNKSGMTAVNKA